MTRATKLKTFGVQELRPDLYRVVIPRPRGGITRGALREWVADHVSSCVHDVTKNALRRTDLDAEAKRCWVAGFSNYTDAALFWLRWG